MKKSILAISVIGLFMVSCNKQKKAEPINNNTDVTETVVEENTVENTATGNDDTYFYKANNGNIVEVVYLNENEPKQVQVKIGDNTLVLDQTSAWAKGAEYKKDNNILTTKGDNITLKKGTENLKLVLISPLTYQYKSDKGSLTATYYFKGDQRFVKLNIDGEEPVTLEQTSAWAKGAEYCSGDIKWIPQDDTAELEKDGNKITYQQVD